MNELYPDAVEYFSLNAQNPKVRAVQISCLVDADHGGKYQKPDLYILK